MSKLKINLAQINTSVGDLEGNVRKILAEFGKANEIGCDLVVFPEMTICGYPCEDLWKKKYFIAEIGQKILEICDATLNAKCAILVGAPYVEILRNKKEAIRNAVFLIADGEVKKIINKKSLPNYDVFDEKRYFEADNFISLIEFRGLTVAVLICEDLWDSKNLFLLQEQVLDVAIVVNSSPYAANKMAQRLEVARNFVNILAKPLIYVNQVGGQDSLVFDGSSFVLDNQGDVVLVMKSFVEDSAALEVVKGGELRVEMNVGTGLQTPSRNSLQTSSCNRKSRNEIESRDGIDEVGESLGETGFVTPSLSSCQNNYQACVLGLRDYIYKNNFKKVLLGMSGGVDSALVATIAVDALGSENVALYALPSRYNSAESMVDAVACAKNLGVKLAVISIEESFNAILTTLGEIKDLAKENLQSRIRGNILMAISNDSGALLLATSNKSELAMGYATIYGDMCGAFNPIKDLYKTQIYELVNWRNCNIPEISCYKKQNLIPQNIIIKEPTAELRPNQKDSDSLPEYDILDKILYRLIEEEKSVAEIIKSGFAEDLVKKIAKSFYLSEYKRRQAVIGCKISEMSFDRERRYPITNIFTK